MSYIEISLLSHGFLFKSGHLACLSLRAFRLSKTFTEMPGGMLICLFNRGSLGQL